MLIRGSSPRALAASLLFPCLLFPSPQPVQKELAAPEASPSPTAEELTGVVVESLGGWTLEKAGVQAGDVLLSWKRLPAPPANPEPAEGVLAGYFDWEELLIEQAPRGTVVLTGRRGEEAKEFTVEPGLWEAKVRPVLAPELEEIYERGKAQLDGGDLEAAAATWRSLVDAVPESDARDLKTWMLLRIGEVWGVRGEWGKAAQLAQEGVERAESVTARLVGWGARGEASEQLSEYEAARAAYSFALRTQQEVTGGSLGVANSLNNLAVVAWATGRFDRAKYYFLEALRIQEQLAPRSLELAGSLGNLAVLSQSQGDLERARNYYLRSLEIKQQRAPKSLSVANNFIGLGAISWARGELPLARDYYASALEIISALAPRSLQLAGLLNNLGTAASDLGELDQAHRYHSEALRVEQDLSPQGREMATTLNNLGVVSRKRGDFSRAQDYLLSALRLEELISPKGTNSAVSLSNLGSIALSQDDLATARAYYAQALRLEDLSTESLEIATCLDSLGIIAQRLGEWRTAADFHERALQLRERLAPSSLDVAPSLFNLGLVESAQGNLSRAEALYLRALQIQEREAPRSLLTAPTLRNLAVVTRAQGRVELARSYFLRALEALDHQLTRLGGSYSVEAGFQSQHRSYYFDFLDLLLTQNQKVEAFQTLERYRAQTFLGMLSERDIAFSGDIPEELDRERRRVGVLYDRTLRKLAGLNLRDHEKEVKEARIELRRLDDEAGDIEVEIRKASPRLAALRYPEPLDAERARLALDPGTLLLSWSVGKDKSALFTLGHDAALEVYNIPLGEEALRAKVQHLLTILPEARGDSAVAALRRNQLTAASRELFDLLLAPAAERIAASERLLILPDGPLHALPFGALIHRATSAEGEQDQFFAAWKPLHVALSATVFAELKNRRRGPPDSGVGAEAPPLLAAFGDPVYPQHLAALKDVPVETVLAAAAPQSDRIDPTVRGAAERGLFDFQPLPYTRREVEGIASLFPAGTTRTFLGAEALEDRVKTLDPKTRILHFAAHAGIDEHLPSGSFIALTVPAETPEVESQPTHDNGLLQVWEIVERVRIDADLVVLSACESGLGKELGGEGLIGLTRAFQYAGARSVMASLWNVNDQATAELMIRFYRHLRAGKTKDEALRAAQRELIEAPIEIVDEKGEKHPFDASAPYYWAAFQVYGDWQ
ncbi:MAG: CHAT domain-containing tetratricopeptide repeat protein [Acidobacteriota bacterium]